MSRRYPFGVLAVLLCGGVCSPGTCQEFQPLYDVIAAAGSGEANGHSFERLVDLDPEITYTGGVEIDEDVCIRGNGATIDLQGECIAVREWGSPTRFDIDHCLIMYGGGPCAGLLGGGITYTQATQGWVVNNTLSIAQQWVITRRIERGGK